MASIHEPDEVVDKEQVFKRLGDLYENGLQGQDDDEAVAAIFADSNLQKKLLFGSNGYDPNTVIPKILLYLRDKDAQQDVNWFVNFPIIRGYLAEAHRKMVTGELGFHDPKLRAALEDARVMVKVHLHSQSRFNENTPWTDDILRGQTTQQRLLTYPKVFPPPKPDRSKSQYRRVQPMPRPNDTSPLWKTTFQVIDPEAKLSHFAEIDNYVESENKFFEAVKKSVKTGKKEKQTSENDKFRMENEAYEHYMTQGLAETSNNPPSPPNDGPKGPVFYKRRGWQRAALQQCLNLFTNREHRVINTPWRRAVLPYDPPAPLPKEIAFVQRISKPSDGTDEKEKDPFAWLHWSFQYAQIVDFLATCQRRRYIYQSWSDFRAPALPINFRGPHISRGLTVHDQHWLKIGDYLENLETMLRGAWEAAPRPLLRAILRDIDAGRRDNTGGPNMDNSQYLPAEDDEDTLDRKRHWRRDIKRRLGIDNIKDNTEDDNYRLIDEYDVAWLRHLCEPSRTLEMCDSSKLPSRNLTTIFDAKLQSYFRDYAVSGAPDSTGLHIWAEDIDELDDVKRTYKPNTLREVLAYINGCKESELKASGDTDPNPEHPNACYQFSIEEAEFMCIELQNLGRCRYIPEYMREPARVGRPTYTVHPEDRITWRYADLQEFREQSAEYLEDMVNHYDISYGNWSLYNGNRPRFSRELEFILDHVGPDFRYELERVETQQKIAASHEAFGKRRAFIKDHLAPEGLCQLGHVESGGTEFERDAPYREDLASWEAVGAYLTKLYKQNKEKDAATNRYFPNEPFHPQTPEKTVQFFRNLAYRAGRTLRHVNQIKNRLQYTESSSDAGIPLKPSLDLSADLKEPRPENGGDGAPAPTIVEKWWQAIPSKDYELAVEKWNTTIQGGTGELALLPPDIKEVLEKADPNSSSQHPLKENQDPFTIIREGIIDACFQNRPTVYPGRISAFKDQENKGFQGYERPSLFEWATKDQRRYQAPHTRRHFFNMQRWPASRILPQRLEAIQQRKDQGARIDPSKPDQAYGILTNRVPIGAEKPVYAHPLIHHGHGDRWNDFGEFGGFGDFGDWSYPDGDPDPPRLVSDPSGGNTGTGNIEAPDTGDDNNNANDIQVNTVTIDDNYNANDIQVHTVILDDNYNAMGAKVQFQVPTAQATTTQMYEASTTTEIPNIEVPNIEVPKMEAMAPELAEQIKLAEQAKAKESVMRANMRARKARRRALVPYTRSDEKFAPGPAVFPMGDTLLQKVMISNELNNALYPEQPFYKSRLLGLPRVWQKIIGGNIPLVPLVPQATRANIPRSNPRKRKMPIEFLNTTASAKKFHSDLSMPIQPGGSGGQFAAGTRKDFSKADLTVHDDGKGEQAVTGTQIIHTAGGEPGPTVFGGEAVFTPKPGGGLIKQQRSTVKSYEDGVSKVKITSMNAGEDLDGRYLDQNNPVDAEGNYIITHPPPSATQTAPLSSTAQAAIQAGAWPEIFENSGQTASATTPVPAADTANHPLRVYPDPSRTDARARVMYQFGRGWESPNSEPTKYMFSAAVRALEYSINHQLARIKVSTSLESLTAIATFPQALALQPYLQSNFDIFALARLLEIFGEQHKLKLQLGFMQQDPTMKDQYMLPGRMYFAPFLVGSKYDDEIDKIVVWIRLSYSPQVKDQLVNPYLGAVYNSYHGVKRTSQTKKSKKSKGT